MQAATPVIATQHRALPELVTHQEGGLLVRPQDMDDLAAAIDFMARNPDAVLRMGRQHAASGDAFWSDTVVGDALAIIFPSI